MTKLTIEEKKNDYLKKHEKEDHHKKHEKEDHSKKHEEEKHHKKHQKEEHHEHEDEIEKLLKKQEKISQEIQKMLAEKSEKAAAEEKGQILEEL